MGDEVISVCCYGPDIGYFHENGQIPRSGVCRVGLVHWQSRWIIVMDGHIDGYTVG